MRLYDSAGTSQHQSKPQSTQPSLTLQQHQQQQQRYNLTSLKPSRLYYQGEDTKNPLDYRSSKFNMEQSWNPVNNYIYGVSMQSVYNQPERETPSHRKLERILNINGNVKEQQQQHQKSRSGGGGGSDIDSFDGWSVGGNSKPSKSSNREKSSHTSNRRLLGEFLNNEAPRLCDHAVDFYDADSVKKRFCSPVESYISTGRDMVSIVSLLGKKL